MQTSEMGRLAVMLASGAFIGWALRTLADLAPAPVNAALGWVTLLLAMLLAGILFLHHAGKGGQR